ncbi:caspase-1-like isoform X2 [Eriocheir sinensis]|uniref:caspase-1-like isoform X2 n=1 Tax=Eriocheir sinensis TaxID=95602 RepID=UPI0021CA4C42|nr:caspase-1-like isoform X2 [Eriocheir sinensis]
MDSSSGKGDNPHHKVQYENFPQADPQPANPPPEEMESGPEENINRRPNAVMPVKRDATEYNMNHKKRGTAIILVHDRFDSDLKPRDCARHDTDIIKNALTCLSFHVEESWNLTRSGLYRKLNEVSCRDHQDSDCLVIVFMSHGGVDHFNKEYLCTKDGRFDTTELWKSFTADKCPSLAGKPKLFFIQACRGMRTDKGVRMKHPKGLGVQTDSYSKPDYVIPLHADMLIMWASYPGMYAFKSNNNGISGSVFIHFLAKVFSEDGRSADLPTLLLRVTREVATLYESYHPVNKDLDQNKQIPYIVSTLMRKVYFPVKT